MLKYKIQIVYLCKTLSPIIVLSSYDCVISGDPSDKTLRKVEREVVIPKLMKERAKELCHEEVKAFNDCGKLNGLLLPFKCRKENSAMQECTIRWYKDPNFVEQATNQFLEERSEYRRTGIPKKYRQNPKETV